MASTPASLPSLGLLDGLGAAPSGATDSPASLPSLALLGGLGEAAAAVSDPGLLWLEQNPLAWQVDPGFAAAYAFQPVGIAQANRDDVTESTGNQGGDPAPLPHLGLLLAAAADPPAPEPEGQPQRGAGRSSRRRPYVVEIDGEDFVVNSEEEAVALLDKAKEQAEKLAEVQIARAAKAERRKTGKVIADARKTLVVPQIKAPGLESYAAQVLADIRDTYASTMRTIEVAALLRKRDREEEDDEDVLLLLL